MVGGFFKKNAADMVMDDGIVDLAVDPYRLTPDGFGFSTPASRILKLASRNGGYYRAAADESVLDVIEAITDGTFDVALVYEKTDTEKRSNEALVGIFTEADYIRVRHSSPKVLNERLNTIPSEECSLLIFFLPVLHSKSRELPIRGRKCLLPCSARQGFCDQDRLTPHDSSR